MCDEGNYAAGDDNSGYTCTPCPLGTYQPATGSLICVDCASGKTTASTGSTEEDDCIDTPNCVNTPCNDANHMCTDTNNGPVCTCPSAYIADGDTCVRKYILSHNFSLYSFAVVTHDLSQQTNKQKSAVRFERIMLF